MTYAANDKAIRYRVGIDVGLRSIGFCAVEVDEHDQPLNLLNSTVFIHDAGVDPNENKAAKSRKLTAGSHAARAAFIRPGVSALRALIEFSQTSSAGPSLT